MHNAVQVVLLVAAVTFAPAAVHAQDATPLPRGRFVFAGYGDVVYESTDGPDGGVFGARFVPVLLFSLNDRLHIEAETGLSISEDGATEVDLEYARAHYFLSDTTTLTAGKFLLNFGQFGPSWHPSWINRTPWTPGIYGGHGHGSTGTMTPLLPVLNDSGIGLQQIIPLSGRQKVFVDVYVSNGARAAVADHDEAEASTVAGEDDHDASVPELQFGQTGADNNRNKAVGGRVAYAMLPALEVGASLYHAAYDDHGELNVDARGLDVNLTGRHYIVRGEYILTRTDAFEGDHDDLELHTFDRSGWFLQGTLQLGAMWPQLRSTEVVVERARVNRIAEASRWVFGVNYWLDARSVVKVAYETVDVEEHGDTSRFAVQLSYGF